MSDYAVRPAKEEEIEYLISMGSRLHLESAFKSMDYDPDKLYPLVEHALKMNNIFFFEVIEHVPTEVPIGMMMGGIHFSYFGADSIAQDMFLMVEREHRGRCNVEVKEILSRYTTWARGAGAKRVYVSTTTGIDPVRTAKLFETCGFQQIGTIHEAQNLEG